MPKNGLGRRTVFENNMRGTQCAYSAPFIVSRSKITREQNLIIEIRYEKNTEKNFLLQEFHIKLDPGVCNVCWISYVCYHPGYG